MSMIRYIALVLAFFPAVAWGASTSTPVGCPIGGSQCSIPVYPFGSPYPINKLVQGSDGNIYQSQVSTNVANPTSATECGVNWKPYSVTTSFSVAVPAQCATIQAAVTFAIKPVAAMAKNATGTINVADGTQTPSGPINLDSPFGRQFNIIGDVSTPASNIINYAGFQTTAAVVRGLFELTNGNGFGSINGFTYNGPSNSVCTPNCGTATSGYPGSIFVYATGSGSYVTVGPNVVMHNGYSGIAAFFGASIIADGTTCTGSADGCYWAYGAFFSAMGANASGSATPLIFAGAGFLCDNRAYCVLDGAFTYSNNYGVAMFNNSTIRTNGPGGRATIGIDALGVNHPNVAGGISLNDSSIYNIEGAPIFGTGQQNCNTHFTNWIDSSTLFDTACNVQGAYGGNGSYSNFVVYNGSTTLNISINKSGSTLFGDTSVKTAVASQGNFPLWFVANNLVTQKNRVDQSVMFLKGVYSGETTFTVSGCSATSPVGSGTAGKFTSGTTGACTAVITLNGATGMTAANGWSCWASDRTTSANLISNTADSTTTATIAGTTVSGDVISFGCAPY